MVGGRGVVIMSDHCKINRAQQSCNNVASSEHGAPHRSCCSLTRMSRPATGKKTPGELSAGDREAGAAVEAISGLFS